jgi:hypothetical protein
VKRFAERKDGLTPVRGYVAPCRACGLMVVHAYSTDEPFHMHKWSKRCKELAEKRARERKTP